MSSSSYTEKEIKQLVRDAVKAALKDQKDAHDEVIQKLVNGWPKGEPLAIIGNKSHDKFRIIL